MADKQLLQDYLRLKQQSYEFLKLVKKMRKAQKEYFRTRSPQKLQEAKALEKKIDKFIENYLTPTIF